jgi:hypothetical protein
VAASRLPQFFGKTTDDVPAGPIGHAVDPNNKTAGRKPAEMIVSLDQQHIGAKARRRNGGGRSGGSAANHQDVSFGEHRHFVLRLDNRFRRTRALGAAASLEKLDTNRRANAAREVAAPWRLAEDLALSNRTAGGRCVFVAAHWASQPLRMLAQTRSNTGFGSGYALAMRFASCACSLR